MLKLRDEIASSDQDWMGWAEYVKVCQSCGIVDRAEQRMVVWPDAFFLEVAVTSGLMPLFKGAVISLLDKHGLFRCMVRSDRTVGSWSH